jgi:hypothetical protein
MINREYFESRLEGVHQQFMDGAITANEAARWLLSYRATFEMTWWQGIKLSLAFRLLNWL